MKSYTKIIIILLCGAVALIHGKYAYAQESDVARLIQEAQKSGIEQNTLSELQNRAQERGISDSQLETILKTAISMSEENLPADVVVQKSLEGLSKGIQPFRIVTVVGQLKQSMGQAAEVIDPWMKEPRVKEMLNRSEQMMQTKEFRIELVKAASKSIMQHITSETIKKVLSQIGTESVLSNTNPTDIVAAMGILPDLSASSNAENAGSFVVRALKGGFKAEALQKLPSAIRMAKQRSELPAASILERVSNQMREGVPARQIVQNLFEGKIGGGPPGNKPNGLNKKPNNGHSQGS